MKKLTHPTYVSLVLEQLRAPNTDFMNISGLIKATGCTMNQVCAALHLLRKYRCIDVVINADGSGWGVGLPPEQDTRLYVKDEIARERAAPAAEKERRAL